MPSHLDFDAAATAGGLRVGYFPAWMKDPPATDVDRAALETVKRLGMVAIEATCPTGPTTRCCTCCSAKPRRPSRSSRSAAIAQMKPQVPDAWPNLFREVRFLSAVDFVQADRFRRRVAMEMARVF